MLLGGRVADASITEEPVRSIRALGERLHADERVDVSFLAIDDGLYLVQKRF
jgi:predicted O-methyltransferase YrrM